MTARKKTLGPLAAAEAANEAALPREAVAPDAIVDAAEEHDLRFAVWLQGLMELADDHRNASADDKEMTRMALFRQALKAGQTDQAPFLGSTGAAAQFDEARETTAYYDWQFKAGDVTPLRAYLERARAAFRPLPMKFVLLSKGAGHVIGETTGRGMADALVQFRRSESPQRARRVDVRPKGRA